MATFQELLEYNATQLEALTDEELYEYLKPCLVDCPPIDIAIVEAEEAKIKAEKDKIKLEAKAIKDAERAQLREAKLKEKEELRAKLRQEKGLPPKNTSTSISSDKAIVKNPVRREQMLDMLAKLQEQAKMLIEKQKK